jgi:two-component system response regulator AtoC
MMTAYASVDTAIEAMKLGAFDYLIKPLRPNDLLHRLQQIADITVLRDENRRLKTLVAEREDGGFAARSQLMREVEATAAKVAPTNGTVLITGESGTGKSHIARQIHEQSPRQEAPFVAINCGAIPENLLESEFFGHTKGAFTGADRAKKGLFREADGGTLFLDEVAELPLALQVKLLHVLEDKAIRPVGSEQARKVDVRIIAATNRDIRSMVRKGEFREDLFYRLNVLHIHMPPLRDRTEDLPELIRYFARREAKRLGLPLQVRIDPAAEDLLARHAWSGNLRELQNVLARALVLAEDGEIAVVDLPSQVTGGNGDQAHGHGHGHGHGEPGPGILREGTLRDQVRDFEARLIHEAIEECGGDRMLAAHRLGIGLSTLYRKLDDADKMATAAGSGLKSAEAHRS